MLTVSVVISRTPLGAKPHPKVRKKGNCCAFESCDDGVIGASPGIGIPASGGIIVTGVVIGDEPGIGVTSGRAVTPAWSVKKNCSPLSEIWAGTTMMTRAPNALDDTHETPVRNSGRSIVGWAVTLDDRTDPDVSAVGFVALVDEWLSHADT